MSGVQSHNTSLSPCCCVHCVWAWLKKRGVVGKDEGRFVHVPHTHITHNHPTQVKFLGIKCTMWAVYLPSHFVGSDYIST